MKFSPLEYEEPVFRPPSEANSLIFQVTIGCSWNKCAFCEMYTSKVFRIKKEEEIEKEIYTASQLFPDKRKFFLCDGNAMVLSFSKLLKILEKINRVFKKVQRISVYALPGDVFSKSEEELKILREAGLSLIYVGIESGDDQILKMINKNETYDSTVSGLKKAREAGIKTSVMILNGLGGKKYYKQHAINSARLVNQVQPEYLSTLVLSFPFGESQYRNRFDGTYIPMSIVDLLKEMEVFVKHMDLESTIFRSDHASNYLVLRGILSRDKEQFLSGIRSAIQDPDIAGLRQEWQRGL